MTENQAVDTRSSADSPELIDLTVSARTNTRNLAFRVERDIIEGKRVTLTAGGSHAVNQMTKALAIARGRLMQRGIVMMWYSYWQELKGHKDSEVLSLLQTRIETWTAKEAR